MSVIHEESGADVYTLEEFRNCVKSGLFNEYDGSAYYGGDPAVEKSDAGVSVDLAVITPMSGYAYVWWYNK